MISLNINKDQLKEQLSGSEVSLSSIFLSQAVSQVTSFLNNDPMGLGSMTRLLLLSLFKYPDFYFESNNLVQLVDNSLAQNCQPRMTKCSLTPNLNTKHTFVVSQVSQDISRSKWRVFVIGFLYLCSFNKPCSCLIHSNNYFHYICQRFSKIHR